MAVANLFKFAVSRPTLPWHKAIMQNNLVLWRKDLNTVHMHA